MNDPVKQHYVPQTYLKFFAQERKRIWEIAVADKKNKKPYLANIRDVAFEKNFYTIEELGEQKYVYEKFYAEQVEPLISKTFNQLISHCTTIFCKNRDIVIKQRIEGGTIAYPNYTITENSQIPCVSIRYKQKHIPNCVG
jgi:hypothetical protein